MEGIFDESVEVGLEGMVYEGYETGISGMKTNRGTENWNQLSNFSLVYLRTSVLHCSQTYNNTLSLCAGGVAVFIL